MKRKAAVAMVVALLMSAFVMAGCDKYVSSYSATFMVQSHTSSYADVSFGSLSGHMSYKFKSTKEANKLTYTASLEKGSATVFIDSDGTKKELFKISGGETVSSAVENLPEGTVYIIFETNETCEDGDLDFEMVEK